MIPSTRNHRVLPCLALVLAAGCGGEASTSDARMNLVLVVVDTTRADHLGYHGYERPTPTLDALAAESAVFRAHHSHSSRTGPAVASLITGLHPKSHGVVNPLEYWDAKGRLAPENETLAEVLSGAGYRCHGIVGNLNVGARFGFDQGFDSYELLEHPNGPTLNAKCAQLGLASGDGPFFVYLHYMEPHSSYITPPPYSTMYADPAYAGPFTGLHAELDDVLAGKVDAQEADRRQVTALYDQEVRYFDDILAELLAWLAAEELAERTLLVVVADHGEELFDHGAVLHGYTLYQEQLHVPLLIRDPRRPASEVVAVTRHVDLLPTVLELLELPFPGEVQGASLVPLMDGAQESAQRPVFAQSSLRAVKTVRGRSLTSGNWKVIETLVPEPRTELYDLAADPGERRDLALERPEELRALLDELRAFDATLPARTGGAVELSDDEIERLKALGYMK